MASVLSVGLIILDTYVNYGGPEGQGFNLVTYTVTYAVYFFAAVFMFSTGIVGIAATGNLERVRNADPVIIRSAVNYWRLNLFLFIYYLVGALGSAVLATIEIIDQRLTVAQAAFALSCYWLIWAIGVWIQAYFLYIIWSYKYTLQLAREGTLQGPFVIKGVYFQNGGPVPVSKTV